MLLTQTGCLKSFDEIKRNLITTRIALKVAVFVEANSKGIDVCDFNPLTGRLYTDTQYNNENSKLFFVMNSSYF